MTMPRYIDADALIDFLDVGHLRHPSELCFSEVDVANLLLHAPTISTDEVRGVGEWIHFTRKYISGVDDEGVPMIRCSVCDYTQFESSRSSTNYCPNCGAKMEVSEDV